ncbi:cell division protein FtsX [Chitinophaga parva]|uniref:Cell division protein FtsX n=1 Tax=Chitinophaga parva TaxID=2169414 RepID=A0A2T7BJL9_9BACT|nr:ABC transporter permease [Chitinophaga parva]PUZ26475.1 cell division protein FtsX [Chitinophaga parva]
MFRNYIKLTLRNLWRNKIFSAINILGLSLGIAICLLIMLFIRQEWSYDRFHKNADNIVRVIFKGTVNGQLMKEANVMPPTAQTLLEHFPEVQAATRLRRGSVILRLADNASKEDHFTYADPNFFRFFTFPLLEGNAGQVLQEPNTIVITRAIAHKYFGDADPIGKVLTTSDGMNNFRVTGVMQDMPVNSHFHFDLVASMTGNPDAKSTSWMDSGFFTYLQLKPGTDYKELEAKLPHIVDDYIGPQFLASMGYSLSDYRRQGNDVGLYLQPLTSIHLHSDLAPATELEPNGDIRYLYIFGAVAVFMLLIACINFMNLSTAGATKRAREVGVRKVLGSDRAGLIRQFLSESLVLTFISMIIAVVLLYVALPGFNNLTGKALHFSLLSEPYLVPGLLLFGLCTGLFAGSYPAFMLSSFTAARVLKGSAVVGKQGFTLRSGLVVFQFFVSITLIVSTVVVYRQLEYIQHKKLGYDKNQVLIIQDTYLLGAQQEAFYQSLLHDARVQSVSNSAYLPAGASNNNNFFVYTTEKTQQTKALRYYVDDNYIATMGMQMAMGRNFSRQFGTDSAAAILNETAVKALRLQGNPIGQLVNRSVERSTDINQYHIIGVVKDFHFRSMHEAISPLIMTLSPLNGSLIVKIRTSDVHGLVASLEQQWKAAHPPAPFVYSFLDDRFKETYNAELKTSRTLGIFACLTILVACLGLFGLATFTAEQRTKEIGVRKVMGANVPDIVALLSKDFLKLVLVANVLALPLAWYVMRLWLQDYAYHTSMNVWIFFAAAALAVLVALVAVGFQSVKAAMVNPVKSLRNP